MIKSITFVLILLNYYYNHNSASELSNEDFNLIPLTLPLLHGVNIPRIGLGTAAMQGKSRQIVLSALNIGYRLIDTAQAQEWYDEKGVGEGIDDFLRSNNLRKNSKFIDNNDDITIVTKIHPRSYEYNKMHSKIIESQKLLCRDQAKPLDVVLLHAPYCWQGHCTKSEEAVTWITAWSNLEEIKSTGIISNIGVSNFHFELLYQLIAISSTRISVIQNWMDPFNQDKEVRRLAKENDIVYMAYSSFGTQWEHKFNGENPVFNSIELQNIALKHNTSISQVVLSWLIQEDVIAIPRSTSIEHLKENFNLIERNEDDIPIGIRVILDDIDLDIVDSLDGSLGDLWG